MIKGRSTQLSVVGGCTGQYEGIPHSNVCGDSGFEIRQAGVRRA